MTFIFRTGNFSTSPPQTGLVRFLPVLSLSLINRCGLNERELRELYPLSMANHNNIPMKLNVAGVLVTLHERYFLGRASFSPVTSFSNKEMMQ